MMTILVQTGLKKNVEVQIDDEDQTMLYCVLYPIHTSLSRRP
ncbi:hypothetical protein Goklo_006122 [Gossypium klotzschianum]|uniref:Uncharacterized protein n=1 Tax=Gossypium klotzschianum TaxID=34286 RepID=A0A7J8VGH3_9ROSI|nr:hypothetical protein [Gossypium klotzschianum]